MKDDRVYLSHVLRCIARIEGYTAGGRDSFFASHRLSTLALSEPRIAAVAQAPLLEHEAVEIFCVAGL